MIHNLVDCSRQPRILRKLQHPAASVKRRNLVRTQSALVQVPYSRAVRRLSNMSHLLRTLLTPEDSKAWQASLAAAMSTCPTRLLLLIQGATEPNTQVLQLLTEIFDITARVAPMLDVVPLLPCAGWSEELVVEMISIAALLTPSSPPPEDLDLYERLRQTCASNHPPQLIHLEITHTAQLASTSHNQATADPLISPSSYPVAAAHPSEAAAKSTAPSSALPGSTNASSAHASSAHASNANASGVHASGVPASSAHSSGAQVSNSSPSASARGDGSAVPASSTQQLSTSSGGFQVDWPVYRPTDPGPNQVFALEKVAVGGTFDRLHAGHRLLLAASAAVCTGHLTIGVTADALLANKSNKSLLQSYDTRVSLAEGYVRAVNPGIEIETFTLSDPKEPTVAELDRDMQAIVVSEETMPGAKMINQGRVARGFAPLLIVVVGLVGLDAQGAKLSSSALRCKDALAQPVLA